ncbi:tetratricopeptide repeat protein [Pseudoalteromonas sp. OOF1S-7]|uniref:tetratricopeptide repeat protein n=1 Tax=Pseudoalteromonas sp. OOF1S-7 TaxID=2917757 RepID=UPI001EF4C4B8|nr:tetratricopeptide repeat protein [Pseudoalteromonas sp. OOF1S-7]MCG7536826.1 tetratricopeptide repeat protein [Pseudoalteromonas sp. OOF1S-7]
MRIPLVFGVLILISVSGYCRAVPTVQEVHNAKGVTQLQLLNQYLAQQSTVDARAALELIELLSPNLPLDQHPALWQRLKLHKAQASKFIGHNEIALSLLNEVLAFARQHANTDLLRTALQMRAVMYLERSMYPQARLDAQTLLEKYPSRQPSKGLAEAHIIMADVHHASNEFASAFGQLLAALAVYEALGDKVGQVKTKGRIGSVYRATGDLDNALMYQLESLEGMHTFGSEKSLAISYNNTGIIYKDLGRYDKAIEMHKQSLALKSSIGYERGMVYSYNNLGESHRLNGDLEQARDYLNKALTLATKLNNRMLKGSTYLYLGRIAITEERLEDAYVILSKALDIYRARKSAGRIAEGLVELGRVVERLGQTDRAISYWAEAVEQARKAQKNIVLFSAYDHLSVLYARTGRYQDAYVMLTRLQKERGELFDLQSQQRIEMLVIQNQVSETKRDLKFVRQQAELTQATLNNKIANRNLLVISVVTGLLLAWFVYRRRVHRRELKLVTDAHQKIEEKEQKLSLALWGSGDVLWDWDLASGLITRENAESMAGIPQQSVNSGARHFGDYVFGDDQVRLASEIDALLNNEQDAFAISYRVRTSDNEWLWVHDKGKVVARDECGKPTRLSGIQHDITLLKQQEADLLVLNSELETLVKKRTQALESTLAELRETQTNLVEAEKMVALGAVVAGIAHEINTPLGTAIMASSNIEVQLHSLGTNARSGSLTREGLFEGLDTLTESVQLTQSALQRTGGLVEQFKKVAVKGRFEQRGTCQLCELVSTAFNLACDSEQRRGVELILPEPVTLFTYIDALLQVLEILFINTLQHGTTQQSLILKVSAIRTEDAIQLCVEDNGHGVVAADRQKIFDPFYTTARHKGNVGLGLHIVYNLVTHVFKSEIQCEQSSFGGAKFSFQLREYD